MVHRVGLGARGTGMSVADSVGWRVHHVRERTQATTTVSSPLLDTHRDLDERERELGIRPGSSFLLKPDGSSDPGVLLYLNSTTFRSLAHESQTSYVKDLKLYLSFLSSQGIDWRDATEDDFVAYEYWRRRDERNPQRVSGTRFSRELAACRGFYKWQVKRGAVQRSPIVESFNDDGEAGSKSSFQPSNARHVRVKWLTPRAYRLWRDVGLGGYDRDGRRDPSWRGRNDGRNLAFADLLWSSGLRLREGSTLLDVELPEVTGGARFLKARVGDAVAKGSGRNFWVSQRALQRIGAYLRTDRSEAVRRAQSGGRYDELNGVLIVTGVTRRRSLKVKDDKGVLSEMTLDELAAPQRRRLFRETPGGLEPVSLWLTEAGLPMLPPTWETVFRRADLRCEAEGVQVRCHPHMLRHSFALRMLVTLNYAFDRRMGLTPDERHDYRMIFGDPFVLVQTMLGHASQETTRNTYLEPVNGLQVELFLNGEDEDDAPVSSLISRLARDAPQINDWGDDGN